ncbi:MAG TPA: HAMP domain-containing sensor histidine kinase [Candidatus Limnocylindrales bacterium]|nr:HAMP domain-containing sensor histidine kinase [Candidatus Limnocylindrales bacterium]
MLESLRTSGLRRYALSIAAIAAAVLLSWPLKPLQDVSTPLFVLAVLVSAWYGGPGPAALAAILAVLTADFFFIAPYYSVEFNIAFVERSIGFGLILALVIWFAHVRKRAEEQLREQRDLLHRQTLVLEAAEEDLRRADRQKDEFLAVLSHEFRNPLGALRNGIYILESGREKDLRRIHEMMNRQLDQLLRLIEDLLDVSRITRGNVVLRKEPVELATLVRDAVEASRASIESQGHDLSVSLPPAPVYVEGDPARLAQVLTNILNNAAKFTPRPGRVRLDAATENGTLIIRVRDNGIGIPPEMLGKVFEMFAQGDRTSSERYGGLGIGLSLVRGLVEAHGGTVEAMSEGSGKGSEIVVRLPAQEAREPVNAG